MFWSYYICGVKIVKAVFKFFNKIKFIILIFNWGNVILNNKCLIYINFIKIILYRFLQTIKFIDCINMF